MSAIDAIIPAEPPARPQRAEAPASVRESARAAERPRSVDGRPDGRDEPSTFADLVDAETSSAAAGDQPSDDAVETAAAAPGAQAKTSKLARKPAPADGRAIVAVATDAASNPAVIAQPQPAAAPNPTIALALASGDAPQTDAQRNADAETPAAPQPTAPSAAAPPAIDFAAAAEALAATAPVAAAAAPASPTPAPPGPNAVALAVADAKPASPAAAPVAPQTTPGQPFAMQPLAVADAQPVAAAPTFETQPAAADNAAPGISVKLADVASLKPEGPAAQASATSAPAPQAPAAPAPMLSAPAPAAAPTNVAATPTPAALAAAPDAAIQVYHRVIERHDGRSQRFELRLDPAELGRVDIRIEVNADKKVHAILAAHDSAALSDLVKGQKGLEQALRDSGLDLADGGLKFELSADTGRGFASSQQRSQSTYDPGARPSDRAAGGDVIALPTTPETAAAAPAWRPARLNLVA